MATITGKTFTYRPRGKVVVLSDAATPTDDFELTGLPKDFASVQLSVRFFDGVGAPIAATAGDFVVEIRTETNNPVWEKPPQSTVQALTPTTIAWSTYTEGVRVTPTSLAGPTTWRVALVFG
jgi:hypothetical protein